MAISQINKQAYASDTSSPTSVSYTLGTGANLLVAFFHWDDPSIAITGTPQYGGQNLTQAANATNTSGDDSVEIWYLISPPTGTNTFTASWSASGADLSLSLCDFNGISTSPNVQTNTGSGSSNAPAVSVTPNASSSLIVACMKHEGNNASSVSGTDHIEIHSVDEGTYNWISSYYIQSGGPTLYSPTYSNGSSDTYAMAVATFDADLNVAPTVALNSPADGATISDTTPDLLFTGTDTESNDIRYNVQVFPWYSSSWSHRVKLTIDQTKVAADLTDYVGYINLANLPAHFHTNVKSDGSDIRVTKADGITEIPIDLVEYDSTNDAGRLDYKYSGTLSGSVNTDIYIYYGNASAAAYTASDTYGRNAVWSDYELVIHGNSETTDSTGNNSITDNGVDIATGGKLWKSLQLQTITETDYLEISDSTSLDSLTGAVSVQAWANFESTLNGGIYYKSQLQQWDNYSSKTIDFGWVSGAYFFVVSKDSTTGMFSTKSATPSTNTWYMLHGTWNGSAGTGNIKFYLDGVVSADASGGDNPGSQDSIKTNDYTARIGGVPKPGGGNFSFDGKLEEIRVKNGELSANWITTEYNNQNSPSTFYSVGTAESAPSTLSNPYINAVSGTDAGFSGSPDNTDPFTSGQQVTYTVQSVLIDGLYYWKVRGLDPSGSNTYGALSSARSFTLEEFAGGTESNSRPAITKGKVTDSNSRPAKTFGKAVDSNNRPSIVIGKATTSDNRLSKIQGKESAADNRSAVIAGKITTSDNRSSTTEGVETLSNSRPAKVYGSQADSSSRSAKTYGRVTITDNRNAIIKGSILTSDDRSAIIKGVDVEVDSRPAKTAGRIVTSDNRSAKVFNFATANDNRNAITIGINSANNNRLAKVAGKASEANNRNATTLGSTTVSESRSSITKGVDVASDARPSKVYGSESANDNRGGLLFGKASTNDLRNAVALGGIISSDNREAVISGVDTISNSRPAKVYGKESDTSSRSARIEGLEANNDFRNAKTYGQSDASDNRSVLTHGQAQISDNRSAITEGVDTLTSTRNAKTYGQDTSSNSRSAILYGVNTDTDTRNSKTLGKVTTSDNRSAIINGEITVEDNRGAIIEGVASNTDSRNAKTSGKQLDSDTRNATTKGKVTSTSSRNAKTKGKKDHVYSKENKVSLPTNNNTLANTYDTQEVEDVSTDDQVYAHQDGQLAGYILHQFKIFNDNVSNVDPFVVTINLKTTQSATQATVYLQVYNFNSSSWETIDSDNVSGANTDFTLTASISSNITNYYDNDYMVSLRVYQGVS